MGSPAFSVVLGVSVAADAAAGASRCPPGVDAGRLPLPAPSSRSIDSSMAL